MKQFLLFAIFCLGSLLPMHAQIVKGDLNNDGKLTMIDANYAVNIYVADKEYEYINSTVDNSSLIGKWYKSVNSSITFNEDGSASIDFYYTHETYKSFKYIPSERIVAFYKSENEPPCLFKEVVSVSSDVIMLCDYGQPIVVSYYSEIPTILDYRAVDLGLPSGTLWADRNVGADAPEGYGDHFAWGETEPKEDYSKGTYKWQDGYYTTKYTFGYSDSDKNDNKLILDIEDDAAYVNWGGGWQMPDTIARDELLYYCEQTRATMNGIKGVLLKGPNGNSIFMPLAGDREGTDFKGKPGEWADYWTINLNSEYDRSAKCWYGSFPPFEKLTDPRYQGQSVRPVYIPTTQITLSQSYAKLSINQTMMLKTDVLPLQAGRIPPVWSSSNTSVATVNSVGEVTAVGVGNATITAFAGDNSGKSASCEVSVSDPLGREIVDLGLSVKWASHNLGATSPEDYGNFYAWGEIEPKDVYDWSTYKWCEGSGNSLTKYCVDNNYGKFDNKHTLDLVDDAAHMLWGGKWRMPTKEEQEELKTQCTWEDTEMNGVAGKLVTSPNGKSIFLPNAGLKVGYGYWEESTGGLYWSSSLDPACTIYGFSIGWSTSNRFDGRSIRPVFDSSKPSVFIEKINLSTEYIECAPGEVVNVIASVCPKNATRCELNWLSSNEDVAIVTKSGMVISVNPGTAIITAYAADGSGVSASCGVAVVDNSAEYYKGHEYVDLGLSVRWATCNIGASTPEEYGEYFAWGETKPKDTYTSSNYFDRSSKYGEYYIYNTTDGKSILEPRHDAACVNWGGVWRMPTAEEVQELIEKCKFMYDGLNGYTVTGPNGNSIYIPLGGYKSELETYRAHEVGYYWTTRGFACEEKDEYDVNYASCLWLNSYSPCNWSTIRWVGCNVRPVCSRLSDR